MDTPRPLPPVEETPRPEAPEANRWAQVASWLGYAAVASILISAYFSASNLWQRSVPLAPYIYYGFYLGPTLGFGAWALGDRAMKDIAAGNTSPSGLNEAKSGRNLGLVAGGLLLFIGLAALIIGLMVLSELGGGGETELENGLSIVT